jgi:hypothetical protein
MDMICRKTMSRCQTPSMCAPFGGCLDPEKSHMAKADVNAVIAAAMMGEVSVMQAVRIMKETIRFFGRSTKEEKNIRGPLTDDQKSFARSLYSNCGGKNPDALEAVMAQISVDAYVNGRIDLNISNS